MEQKTLGHYLRELRKSHGYTQEFAASSLGVSRQAYSHYENGRAIPPNDTCYKIAKLYSIPVEMLIELSLQTTHSEFSDTPHTDTRELDDFLEYIDTEKNKERLKNLTNREKQVLYYFNHIPVIEQNEIIEILKIKIRKTK